MIPNKELAEITEEMAEAAHNAWLEKRKKEKGWHHPDDCPNLEYVCSKCLNLISKKGKRILEDINTCGKKHPFIANIDTAMSCDDFQKRPCDDCHACMIPFDQVPDADKELARTYPKMFLEIIYKHRYEIVTNLEREQRKEYDYRQLIEVVDQFSAEKSRLEDRVRDLELKYKELKKK